MIDLLRNAICPSKKPVVMQPQVTVHDVRFSSLYPSFLVDPLAHVNKSPARSLRKLAIRPHRRLLDQGFGMGQMTGHHVV